MGAQTGTATLANWPQWAQGAFAATGTHAVSKGTPSTRGMLAVAVYYMLTGAVWYCGTAAPIGNGCCGYHVGMLAYGTATIAYLRAGGTLRAAKAHTGLTAASTPAQAAAALAKAGFAPSLAVANGMLGVVANGTCKGTAPLYLAALATPTATATAATAAAPVPNAYAGVPAAQPPKGYTLPKVAFAGLPKG